MRAKLAIASITAVTGLAGVLAYYLSAADPVTAQIGAGDVEKSAGIAVTNATELRAALADSAGGFTVLLSPGDYGRVQIRRAAGEATFARPVTIMSADPCNPARFRQLTLDGLSNVVLAGLHFEDADFFKRPREELFVSPGRMRGIDLLRTEDLSNVTIRDSTFVGTTIAVAGGDPLNGYGYGFGWRSLRVNGGVFTNNRLTKLFAAISVRGSTGVTIAGNELNQYRADGIFLIASKDTTIIDNRILNPRPHSLPQGAGDHPDFIQVGESYGARIENNYLDIGPGNTHSQGIFGGAARNFSIRNNIIATRGANGLRFGSLADSEISNNLVLNASPSFAVPTREETSREPRLSVTANYRNVRITNNIASQYSYDFARAALNGSNAATGNVTSQNRNPAAANYLSYETLDSGRSNGATRRIGHIAMGTLPAGIGPDPGRFAYLDAAVGRCRIG